MTPMDEATIGARLRILRRWRGMTQVQLAGLAALSPSFVSMVENGQRPLDRRSHISALAGALKVSESDLVGGPHLSADPMQSDPHTVIPPLRVALMTNSLAEPATEQARPLPELVSEVARIDSLHQACNYLAVGTVLPAVLDELHYHVAVPQDEAARQIALETLIDACVCATFTAKDLGYQDLAYTAAMRADEIARILDDPVQLGKAAFLRIHTLPRAGSWDRILSGAEKAADALEPHASTDGGAAVLGMLTLSASLSAAVVHNGQRSEQWLGAAAELARRLPDEPDQNWMAFSSTNVGVWRVAIEVERGHSGGEILELASHVHEDKLSGRRGRRAAFLADIGRGLAREPRTRTDAVRLLRRAEDAAPQWIRNNPPVREAVAYLLNRARADAGGRELRGMAARMGVPH
jgi:transcriptional regulator with XRE-family HTH domain